MNFQEAIKAAKEGKFVYNDEEEDKSIAIFGEYIFIKKKSISNTLCISIDSFTDNWKVSENVLFKESP